MKALEMALDAINRSVPETAEESQRIIAAKCSGLIRGYHARWHDAHYVPIGVETVLQSDLWNPSTKGKSRTFTIAGKIDVQAFDGTRYVIFDHKTTSEDISDPASPYWRQLVIEGQLSHYMLLEWLNGRKVDLGIWDVVRKPAIRPKALTKADLKAALFTREYYRLKLSEEDVLTLHHSGSESLAMYAARLAHDCTVERPGWYFQRRPIPRLDSEVIEYAKELWEHAQDILLTRQHDRHVRNSGACMQYGSPCKFLGICSGHDTPDSENWSKTEHVHPELPVLDGDGRRILTNSRIRTFQTCRRKHFYQYEMGIERQDEQEREALFFGNLWHVAQEAWWYSKLNHERKEEYGNISTSAGNGLAEATGNACLY